MISRVTTLGPLLCLAVVSLSCRTPNRGPRAQSTPAAKSARIQIESSVGDFGVLGLGEEAVLSFTVRNTGDAEASSITLETAGVFLITEHSCGRKVAQGTQCSFKVQFGPSGIGTYRETAHFRYADEAGGGDAVVELLGEVVPSGTLDPRFGSAGVVTTAIGSTFEEAHAMAIQMDGKIVLAGHSNTGSNYDLAILRYNTDGSLDSSFGLGGKVTLAVGGGNDFGEAVVVQPDGKILVAGVAFNGFNNDFIVVRFQSTGSLDTAFGTSGVAWIDVDGGHDFGQAMGLQLDGRIVVAGYARVGVTNDFALARLESDGSADTSFGAGGVTTTPILADNDEARALTIQPNGKIVVAGYARNSSSVYEFAVARFETDGTLDSSFNSTGTETIAIGGDNDYAYALAIQGDGRILLAGRSHNGINYDMAVVRLNPNGSLDNSFDGDGRNLFDLRESHDEVRAMALQTDGKILLVGYSHTAESNYDVAVTRIDASGRMDSFFGNVGSSISALGESLDRAYAVGIQSDGKIVVAGDTYGPLSDDVALLRYFR